jgi:lysozyme
MKISERGIALIKEFEGVKLTSYLCPARAWTVGYGHTRTARANQSITVAEADRLLRSDLKQSENVIKAFVKVPLSQNQFDALVSLVFNIGAGAFSRSTLVRLLNKENYLAAAEQILRWNIVRYAPSEGLARRRVREKELFLEDTAVNNSSDLANRIYERMKSLNCRFRAINIVYLEDSDEYGNPLPEKANEFNDRSILLRITDGKPEIIFNALATTEPGAFYTHNPMNPKGAFSIELNKQFRNCWMFGQHGTGRFRHPSLIQVGEITGFRDRNKDSIRSGDAGDRGLFGINQHGIFGYRQTINNIGKSSAGCLVRFDYADHLEFMSILRTWHPRDYLFDTIVLNINDATFVSKKIPTSVK